MVASQYGGVVLAPLVAPRWRHGGVMVASQWRHGGVMVALVYAPKPKLLFWPSKFQQNCIRAIPNRKLGHPKPKIETRTCTTHIHYHGLSAQNDF